MVSFARHDEVASLELVAWADVVICEWCSPVAIWYSRNKRPGQRLVVRLHRMEIYNDWTDQVDINAVDQVVCVSPHYARLTRERTGRPAAKIGVIPNYVDVARFRRDKVSGAEYNLGFVGIVPMRKRVDLAFDVLAATAAARSAVHFVRQVTDGVGSAIRAWRQPEEREYTWMLYRRIGSSELLRDGVVFDRYGPDVAAWMRKIGFVLSTSEDESFHLAPAEGMSSGAVPPCSTGRDRTLSTTPRGSTTARSPSLTRSTTWSSAGAGRRSAPRRLRKRSIRSTSAGCASSSSIC